MKLKLFIGALTLSVSMLSLADDEPVTSRVNGESGTLTVSHGYESHALCRAYVGSRLVDTKSVAPGEQWTVQDDALLHSSLNQSHNVVCSRGSAVRATTRKGFNKSWLILENVSRGTMTCRVSRKGSLFRRVKTRDIVLMPGESKDFSNGTFDVSYDCSAGEEYAGDFEGYKGIW